MKSFIFFLFLGTTILFAQDNCSDVLFLASKDITNVKKEATTAKYIYDRYCSGKSKKSGISLSLSDTKLFEKVNIGFGSTSEKLETLCSTYESNFKSIVNDDFFSSLVVREALISWDKCNDLNKKGVKIKPNVLGESFTIDVERVGDDVVINGVDYNEDNCECFANVEQEDGSKKNIKLNKSTIITIDNGQTFNILCKRIKRTVGDIAFYDAFDFNLLTSEGSFGMKFNKDIKPSLQWISEFEKKLNDLEGSFNKTRMSFTNSINNLELNMNKLEFKNFCVERSTNCDGKALNNLKPPVDEEWIFTGNYNSNTWSGGKCGQGWNCKLYYRIKK